jgi:hypothetical protein
MVWVRRDPQAPAVSAWPALGYSALLAAVAAGIGTALSLEPDRLILLPVSFLVYGLVAVARHQIERARLRRAADAWIARGYDGRAASYAWRIAELTSARRRRVLARSVRRVVSELSDGRLAPVSPLNRAALRPYRHLICRLSRRLDDLDRPVSAAGILAVDWLLTSPASVLYHRGRDVSSELTETIARLEPRR